VNRYQLARALLQAELRVQQYTASRDHLEVAFWRTRLLEIEQLAQWQLRLRAAVEARAVTPRRALAMFDAAPSSAPAVTRRAK
jgi:hypothetical protein